MSEERAADDQTGWTSTYERSPPLLVLQSNPQPNSLAPRVAGPEVRIDLRPGRAVELTGEFGADFVCLLSSPPLFFPSTRQSQREEEEEGSLCFICALPHPLLDPSGTPKPDPGRPRPSVRGRRVGIGQARRRPAPPHRWLVCSVFAPLHTRG